MTDKSSVDNYCAIKITLVFGLAVKSACQRGDIAV